MLSPWLSLLIPRRARAFIRVWVQAADGVGYACRPGANRRRCPPTRPGNPGWRRAWAPRPARAARFRKRSGNTRRSRACLPARSGAGW
ncbi:hypothetical protein G6F63_016384 [Rhizopus arrhizus]|nr:hypothetical protein G6F63_016384 [Rhizopus arrhizus]